MSRKRQTAQSPKRPPKTPDGSVLVRTFGVTFTEGHVLKAHRHEWDQFTYATHGVLTIKTEKGTWVIPPHRAVWVPAGIDPVEVMSGPVAARSLFFVPGLAKFLPRECTAVNVSPLLRELILATIRFGYLDRNVPAQARLLAIILDQFETLAQAPLQLKTPSDPRALQIAALLEKDPASPKPLRTLAREAGASKRTIERLFKADTGVSFQQWRQRLRVIQALRLLASGESVTSVALDVGYS
ncbi:MAG: helix-turn-helix transcriptional regulator, partial [Candidatus Acidiferrales bacterium]